MKREVTVFICLGPEHTARRELPAVSAYHNGLWRAPTTQISAVAPMCAGLRAQNCPMGRIARGGARSGGPTPKWM
jgi:hypothetical protein